jgi:hypothetical protein
MQHGQHMPGMSHEGHGMKADGFSGDLREGGQSAFAAIQEIVSQLMADPTTDWSRVDIDGLRQHLIDMDNVTLRARVHVEEVEGGARFEATRQSPARSAPWFRPTLQPWMVSKAGQCRLLRSLAVPP